MKEYKRRRRNDDFLQVLGPGQTDFERVLNPGAEEARHNQEQAAEQQSTMQRTSLPELHDEHDWPGGHRNTEGEPVDHRTIVLWLVAAVLLVAVIAVAVIFKQ